VTPGRFVECRNVTAVSTVSNFRNLMHPFLPTPWQTGNTDPGDEGRKIKPKDSYSGQEILKVFSAFSSEILIIIILNIYVVTSCSLV
jgi:hypothetical protein